MVQEKVSYAPESGKGTMTASRFRINLGKDAVKLALDGEWERAAGINRAILELYPDDCEASNRLAKALMELGDYPAARAALSGLLARHPNNNIARKNLARLEKLESAGAARPATAAHVAGLPPLFIEDGGKSCTTTLRGAGDAAALANIVAGDKITLNICGDAVAVHSADGRPLGAVEPRLARRLRKLMAGGNQYGAAVVSVSGGALSVVIRETQQHPSLRDVVSFPPLRRKDAADGLPGPDAAGDEAVESADALIVDPGAEPEPEEALPTLATDEIDDDEDGGDDAGAGVPVLDTDDVDNDPILAIVPPPEDDWE